MIFIMPLILNIQILFSEENLKLRNVSNFDHYIAQMAIYMMIFKWTRTSDIPYLLLSIQVIDFNQ